MIFQHYLKQGFYAATGIAILTSSTPAQTHMDTPIWEANPLMLGEPNTYNTPLPFVDMPYQPPLMPSEPSTYNAPLPFADMPYQPPSSPVLYQAAYRPPIDPQRVAIDKALNQAITALQRDKYGQAFPLSDRHVTRPMLAATADALRDWQAPFLPETLAHAFDLVEIPSPYGTGKAKFTGYFTPELSASRERTPSHNIPIYRRPPKHLMRTSHAAIARGALNGLGLEIAWVSDPFDLYLAHVQGSALLHFPDGSKQMIGVDGDNGHPFMSISQYLKRQGYMTGSLSNDAIRAWLRDNPQKQLEVLTSNPRYIFFHEDTTIPLTASRSEALAGHTIAVDTSRLPFGAIPLAELPLFDVQGRRVGNEWRLLFAQDRGKDINGSGRLDLYTGIGKGAERQAYRITGNHRVYLLLRKGL